MPKTFRENLEDIHGELESLSEKAGEIAFAIEDGNRARTEATRAASSEITSAISRQTAMLDFRLGEISWRLALQTDVLFSIDQTLKRPAYTQALEWRVTAEELRRVGKLEDAERLFLNCLEPENNPLDYRSYVGLAKTYELMSNPEKALEYYEESLKFAPKEHIDWRSYSLLLMSSVYKALSEHREAFESTRKAVRFSPKYPAAHYHHARNAALIGDQATCAFSLSEAVRASAQFCVSALLDNHFEPWRSDVAQLIVNETLSANLPDGQYHRAWFELSRHCANLNQDENVVRLLQRIAMYNPSYYSLSMGEKVFERIQSDIANRLAQISLKPQLDTAQEMTEIFDPGDKYHKAWFDLSKKCSSLGQEENSIQLLEKIILHDPAYHSSTEKELHAFAPIESSVRALLEKLHREARERAKKTIADAEKRMEPARHAIEQADLALKIARDKEQLKSRASYESAQSNLDLALKKLASNQYEELLKVPSIAQEAETFADNALEFAREEKVFYEIRRRAKKRVAWREFAGKWVVLIFGVVGGLVGGFVVIGFISLFTGNRLGEGFIGAGLISGVVAGLASAVLYGIWEARQTMGFENSDFRMHSYFFVIILYLLFFIILSKALG